MPIKLVFVLRHSAAHEGIFFETAFVVRAIGFGEVSDPRAHLRSRPVRGLDLRQVPAVCLTYALAVSRHVGPLAAGQGLLKLRYLQLIRAIADRQMLSRVFGLVGLDASLAKAVHGQLLLELGRGLLQLDVLRRLFRGRVQRADLGLLLSERAARAVVVGDLVLMPGRRVLPRHRVVEQMVLIFDAVARLLLTLLVVV